MSFSFEIKDINLSDIAAILFTLSLLIPSVTFSYLMLKGKVKF